MPSSLLNGISISVSDNDSDELAGKMRARDRRKRKKLGFRAKGDLPRRFFRVLRRWWPVVLFLPVIALLILETSKLAIKPQEEAKLTDPKPVKEAKVDPVPDNDVPANLNRLDPVTRVVGGVRQR